MGGRTQKIYDAMSQKSKRSLAARRGRKSLSGLPCGISSIADEYDTVQLAREEGRAKKQNCIAFLNAKVLLPSRSSPN